MKLKRCLITGLIILLPVVLTFWIVSFFIDFFTDPFLGIAQSLLSVLGLKDVSILFFSKDQVLHFASQFLVLIFLFGMIVFIGMVARYFFFSYLMELGDKLIHKIPVVSTVYKTAQELIKTVLSNDAKAFKQVVLVPFPHEGVWTVGLVTRDDPVFGDRISVFVPTTPNPTSGYLILYEKEKVIPIEMKIEDALRYIVSCGVLVDPPKAIPKQHM